APNPRSRFSSAWCKLSLVVVETAPPWGAVQVVSTKAVPKSKTFSARKFRLKRLQVENPKRFKSFPNGGKLGAKWIDEALAHQLRDQVRHRPIVPVEKKLAHQFLLELVHGALLTGTLVADRVRFLPTELRHGVDDRLLVFLGHVLCHHL